MSDYNGVLVYSDVPKIRLQMITAGKKITSKLGGDVSVLLFGSSVSEDEINEVAKHGADKIIVIENENLKQFDPISYTDAYQAAVEKIKPKYVLFGGTRPAVESAPRLATRYKTGVVFGCGALVIDEENNTVICGRVAMGGKAISKERIIKYPGVLIVPGGVHNIPEETEAKAEIIKITDAKISEPKIKQVNKIAKEKKGIPLNEAEKIVGVGRGFKKQEDLEMANELAKVLGNAVVGATRPLAADYGWFKEWIGISGIVVRPKLYFAIGISGAAQHVMGVKDANTIIAINKNPDADIFEFSDYNVVGDLYQILPEVVNELRNKLS